MSLVTWIEKRRNVYKYSRTEWYTHDLLQLQRLAHEELQFGSWSNCAGDRAVPITEEKELLAVIDVQDPSHPRLKEKPGISDKLDNSTNQPSITDQVGTMNQAETSESNDSTHVEETSDGNVSGATQPSAPDIHENVQESALKPDLEAQSPTVQSPEVEPKPAQSATQHSQIETDAARSAESDPEEAFPRL